jgi:hypothetical protein
MVPVALSLVAGRKGRVRRRVAGVLVSCLLASIVLAPIPASAQDPGCTGAGICLPDGLLTITFSKTGDPSCRFDATVDWGDGTRTNVPNFQNLQEVSHTYSPGVYSVSITGSGSSPDPNVSCTFTPSDLIVEIPIGDLPPVCTDTVQPPGCVFVIRISETHITPEMKANYRDGAAKLRQQIDRTEQVLTAPCTPVKIGKDIVKKGLREVIKKLPNKAAKKAAKDLLNIPDVCSSPTEYLSDKARESAERYERLADDPPDPNYKQVPRPRVQKTPRFGSDSLAKAVRRYARSLSRAEAIAEALIAAVEKAQGADQDNNEDWATLQTVTAADLARDSADAIETQLEDARGLQNTVRDFVKSDIKKRRRALDILRARHRSAVLDVVRDSGLNASKFWSAFKKLRYRIPQVPQIVAPDLVQGITLTLEAMRSLGNVLYQPV